MILHEVLVQLHSIIKAGNITTVNPTQFLGFGKNINKFMIPDCNHM